MSWHVYGQVDGPAGIAKLEPAHGAEPQGRAEQAQLADARKVAQDLLKSKRAGAKGPFLVSLAGHVPAGKGTGQAAASVTVSVAHDNSA